MSSDQIPPAERQIMITHTAADSFYQAHKEDFTAALASGAEEAERFSETFAMLPIGIRLTCPEEDEQRENGYLQSAEYREKCKDAFRPAINDAASFYYLSGEVSFAAYRTAVLALTSLTGRNIIAELCVENEDGLLFDGTEVLAAMGVLQRIGVGALILSAKNMESLSQTLSIIAPYARISLGVRIHSAWIREGISLPNAEILVCEEHDDEGRLHAAMQKEDAFPQIDRNHHEEILAPDGKYAHFIPLTIDISDEIACDHRLEQALIDAEDDSGGLKLSIADEDELIFFEELRYMIARPICISAATPELLEKALAIYPGLAIYDGTENFSEEILHYLEQKYGFIRL